jgi:hypothetical protein
MPGVGGAFTAAGCVRPRTKSRQFHETVFQTRKVVGWQVSSATINDALATFDHESAERIALDGDRHVAQ